MLPYQAKIDRAKELREQGFSYKQIAESLNAKASTVYDWVTERKRKKGAAKARWRKKLEKESLPKKMY